MMGLFDGLDWVKVSWKNPEYRIVLCKDFALVWKNILKGTKEHTFCHWCFDWVVCFGQVGWTVLYTCLSYYSFLAEILMRMWFWVSMVWLLVGSFLSWRWTHENLAGDCVCVCWCVEKLLVVFYFGNFAAAFSSSAAEGCQWMLPAFWSHFHLLLQPGFISVKVIYIILCFHVDF